VVATEATACPTIDAAAASCLPTERQFASCAKKKQRWAGLERKAWIFGHLLAWCNFYPGY
jgi:hypothetical protein